MMHQITAGPGWPTVICTICWTALSDCSLQPGPVIPGMAGDGHPVITGAGHIKGRERTALLRTNSWSQLCVSVMLPGVGNHD